MLSIRGFDSQRSEKTMHLLYRAVSELSRVEIVRSSVPSWHILSSLAQANALRRLSVNFPYHLGPATGHLSGDVFPRLRALEIWASSIAQCTDLFRWIPLNQVAEMFICLASHKYRDPLQALVEVSSLVSSQCQSLDFLWISIPLNASTRHVTSTWWRCMLEPYQTCHHLKVIALQVSSSLTLADNDLEDMVKAWPHLEVFHLFPDNSEDPPVQLTFRGVIALLHRCLKLKDFTLMFRATPFQRVARLSNGKLVRNTSVKRMGVHTSCVSENSDVAEYLSIIMPSLKIIRLTERAHEASWS
ncbi:hypothetical protein F5J12DRAFT_829716 [Pisolithus orientalis]|uniref:uncharacterized protein n=1 Tax=Pisolithus orientalis TaxID=936130 RepID=UPI0022259AB3|nr:uncharacterized protein F5J12DRAFT_829716 [Pisolithus orientalis]KAI6007663.1 hypothetical protein F5J12DRAFT_829716 [Pisolithus orientalis]